MLHFPSAFSTRITQRMADLAERVGFDGLHQRLEYAPGPADITS